MEWSFRFPSPQNEDGERKRDAQQDLWEIPPSLFNQIMPGDERKETDRKGCNPYPSQGKTRIVLLLRDHVKDADEREGEEKEDAKVIS